ncbi:hypothetical protein J2848_002732 [Azospirillum lipoferum]|nr:hypothetical protein [Azospirillum lipoferum]
MAESAAGGGVRGGPPRRNRLTSSGRQIGSSEHFAHLRLLSSGGALEHAAQLALYARLVAEASGRPVLGCFIHMPVAGRVLEVG